jgi:hypothetical protein
MWQSSNSIKKEEVILTCLWISHTRLTHRHFLHGELAPVCKVCVEAISDLHIRVECPRYNKDLITFHLHGAL